MVGAEHDVNYIIDRFFRIDYKSICKNVPRRIVAEKKKIL